METSHTTERTLVQLLAIVGLFTLFALLAWLTVQALRHSPSAFMSLANIAETVGNYGKDTELVLTLERNIVNSGDTVTLTWTKMGEGTYTFTHSCEHKTTLSVRTDEDAPRALSCNEILTLPRDAHGLFLTAVTETQRFSDVTFTVTFTPLNGKLKDTHSAEGTLTIINVTAPQKENMALENGTSKITPTSTPEVSSIQPEVAKIPTHTPTVPTPKLSIPSGTTQVASPIISLIPKSYENGFTDLRIAYQGVGIMKNGAFVPQATWSKGDTVALRFEVKNIGTKVSSDWTYALTLPGNSYMSEKQSPLMPNERAILTAQFSFDDVKGKSTIVEGRVSTKGDTNTSNNQFDWSVGLTN